MSSSTPLQPERVLFSQIDIEDQQYFFSPAQVLEDTEELKKSIERVGLLHPPILLRTDNSYYQVVTGHRRIKTAREATGKSSLNCLVLSPETSAIEALAVALEEKCSRRLTSVEQAIFLQKALQHLAQDEVAAEFLPVMGLAPNPYHIQNLLPLLELEEPLRYALHQGLLHELVARELVALSFTDRLALFEVIDLLQLSVGNQKKLTASCKELAKRNNSTIIAILSEPDIQDILNHPEANPPQKAANLMATLTAKRYPRLTEAEKSFQQFTDSLKLPKNATLSHAPAFEKDTVTLSISFKNQEELLKSWHFIASGLK